MRLVIVVAMLGGGSLGCAFGAITSCTCGRSEQGSTIITKVAEGAPEAASPSAPEKTPDAATMDGPEDGSTEALTDASARIVLPPLDTKCSVDADCDYVAVSVAGPYICCSSCGTTIGSKAWVAAVTATCARSMGTLVRACPALGCPMGPTHARCDVGRCVPKW